MSMPKPYTSNDIGKTVLLLHQAIEELENKVQATDSCRPTDGSYLHQHPSGSTQRPSGSAQRPSGSSQHPNVSEIRRLFSPYRNSSTFSRPRPTKPCIKWSHKFSCLSSKDQDFVPPREMKKHLLEADLGEKRLVFDKNANSETFKRTVLEYYPKLNDGGGFELYRTLNRTVLELIKAPVSGYTAEYLADSCSLGQSCIYIRPIQRDLDMESNKCLEATDDCPREECISCHDMIPIIHLKKHISNCFQSQKEDSLPINKRRKLTPICKFTCVKEDVQIEENLSYKNDTEECPICGLMLPKDVIVTHSAECGETLQLLEPEVHAESISDEMEKLRGRLNNDAWNITVVRKLFDETSLDQLMEANEEDWSKKLSVKFIGEEGVDEGGLTREFFSLLFANKNIFDMTMQNLTLRPDLLEKEVYQKIGKAVAIAIVNGHPGPKCFSKVVSEFIINEKIPKFAKMDLGDILQEDAKAAILKINSATEENIDDAYNQTIDILMQTGFNKRLTSDNKLEAVTAIKGYFVLFRTMAPLLQFIEGMNFMGVLGIMKKYRNVSYLEKSTSASAETITNFYRPSFSDDPLQKEDEEIVMYNFNKFFNRLERGMLTSPWIDMDTLDEEIVPLRTTHALQALVGSQFLPTHISRGLVLFDHNSSSMSYVNTCAPSITFCDIKRILKYENFEESFINIIVCAYGFGRT